MAQPLSVTILISSFIIVNCITNTVTQSSPCPDLFHYLPNEATAESWSGELTLKTDVELSGVYLRLVLDSPPTDVTSEFGEVVQREANEYLIRKPGYKVSPVVPEKVKITVQYQGTAPKLTGFRLNAKTVCPSEAPAAVIPGGLISLCPYVFSYDPPGPENDQWSGTLTLTSESALSGIYSRISFDKPPLEVTSDFGDVVQRETNQFLIRKPGHELPAGQALRVKITAKYDPAEAPPKLIGVQLNAKAICPGVIQMQTPPPLAKGLVSPCPQIFSYQSLDKQAGKWHALLLLNTKVALSDVTITILLDRPSLQLGGWNGYLKTQDNIEYQLTKPGLVIQPGVFPIKFFIKYKTSRPIPKLSEISINKLNICPDDDSNLLNPIPGDVLSSFQTSTPRTPSAPQRPATGGSDDDFFTASLDHFNKHGLPLGLNRDNEQCGTVAVQATPFITHGQTTVHGQYPWHAALYHNKNVELTYICGANLISKDFVLTVAHCATKQSTGQPVNAGLLVVVLGKYFLDRYASTGIQERMVRSIAVHPNYDKNSFKNDIALLKLTTPSVYTETVRPICLWRDSQDIKNVIGQEGTVVGWGWNEKGMLSDQLIKTSMPIVERLTCILSYPEFFAKFTNDNNYCAGFRNGSSACNGDSGGGMVFSKTVNGKQAWYIRGLVSVGVALQNLDRCDASHYVVFTDVAKYVDWIRDNTK